MIAWRPTRQGAWQECLDANHVTMTALRAVAQGLAGKQLVSASDSKRLQRKLHLQFSILKTQNVLPIKSSMTDY